MKGDFPFRPFYGQPQERYDPSKRPFTYWAANRLGQMMQLLAKLINMGYQIPFHYWEVAALAVYEHESTYGRMKTPWLTILPEKYERELARLAGRMDDFIADVGT